MRFRKQITFGVMFFVSSLIINGCFSDLPVDFVAIFQKNKTVPGLQSTSGIVTLEFTKGEAHVVVLGLPLPTPDQEYEAIIVLIDGDEIEIGKLVPDGLGNAELEVEFEESLHDVAVVLILRHDDADGTKTIILTTTLQDTSGGQVVPAEKPEHEH